MTNSKKIVATTLALSILSGCASVSQDKVAKRAQEMRDQIGEQVKLQANQPSEPLVKRYSGSYLGGAPIPLAYNATLPSVFRDVTLSFPGRTNLATVGERITEATKIPVRLRPDVFISAKSLVRSGQSQSSQTPNASGAQGAQGGAGASATGMSPIPIPLNGRAANSAITTQTFDDFDARLPMDYSGSLSGYLDLICARLGINWEYKDGSIILYRMVTKVFPVKVSPGSVKFGSTLSKGGGGDKNSFTSSSSTSLDGEYSVWASMESAIKAMLTPLGNSTVDQAGGLIIVTDTKEAIENVGRFIDIENATLTRQVDISVRVLRVAITDTSESGLDFNLLYKKIASGGADWSFGMTPPSTLASSSAGTLGFNILKPDSRTNGSSLLIQALNQIGTVVSDDTTTASTTNRLPVPVGKFSTVTYLAETKPASGGATGSSGPGVPGLTPGTVTTGFFLNVLPTALENNSVMLRLSLDQSELTRIGTISTGAGQTLQQIQTPEIDGTKSDHSVGLHDGESLVLMGIMRDGMNSDKRTSVSGYSATGKHLREMQIIVVTPKVRAGV